MNKSTTDVCVTVSVTVDFLCPFRAQKEADYEKKQHGKKTSFAEKIVEIIRTSPSINEMREQLQDYHDNDIAQSLQFLNRAERNLLYSALDAEWLAEIISYLDDPAEYIDEIGIDKLAEILNEMDADDAVDLWENIDESVKSKAAPDDR